MFIHFALRMEKTSASNFNIRLLISSIKIIIIFYVVISLFTCSTFVNARMEQSIEFRGTGYFFAISISK